MRLPCTERGQFHSVSVVLVIARLLDKYKAHGIYIYIYIYIYICVCVCVFKSNEKLRFKLISSAHR